MRSYEEYHEIMRLWETGLYGKNEISRLTGIPKTTVQRFIARYETVARFEVEYPETQKQPILEWLKSPSWEYQAYKANYAYIFGLYLGDGHISYNTRSLRLMIYLDNKYPKIIQSCIQSIETLMPDNTVGTVQRSNENCIRVSCVSRHWHEIFPQHGEGMKHTRKIELEAWQQAIIETYPLEFLRGLYHSDGSRSQNIVKGKNYPRYFFTNVSDDIRTLFTDTVERLGLEWRQTNKISVAISKREYVEWLDEHVGAKE